MYFALQGHIRCNCLTNFILLYITIIYIAEINFPLKIGIWRGGRGEGGGINMIIWLTAIISNNT